MRTLSEAVAAFFAIASFAVLFRVPTNSIVPAGIAGTICRTVYVSLQRAGMSRFAAAFISAAVLSLVAEWLARRLRIPVSILEVPGIIPLVPGADAYFAMLAFLQNKDQAGLRLTVVTALVALSIAAGIVTASTLVRALRRRKT